MPSIPTKPNKSPSNSYLAHEDCPAKTTDGGKPGLPVFEHCAHVGYVANALLNTLPPIVRSLFPAGVETLCASHDIGKISPGFVYKVYPALLPNLAFPDAQETNHACISEATYLNHRQQSKKIYKSCDDWGIVLGIHHGFRSTAPLDATCYGGAEWEEQRQIVLKKLIKLFGPLPQSPPTDELIFLVSGLCTVADWIGSDPTFFSPSGNLPFEKWESTASESVLKCGFSRYKQPTLTFDEVFGFKENQLQRKAKEIYEGPGIYIIEAPMGMGKTEAALNIHRVATATEQTCGLYFGLPTVLTSNVIWRRVSSYVEACIGADASVNLVHSMSWLISGGEELRPGRSWFTPAKRSLLSPYGVGTIDQALMGALRVKHFYLRLFGLAGKVVILDEVHSYDAYTSSLIAILIQRLVKLNSTVVILSATLTQDFRDKLLGGNKTTHSYYPQITSLPNKSYKVSEVSIPPPPDRTYQIKMEHSQGLDWISFITDSTFENKNILMVFNTIKICQDAYDRIIQLNPSVPVGIIHSRFTPKDRTENEDQWISSLGKSGPRPHGSILVATQVVEQSIDIDADYLVSEICPIDMLLQRMGRLFRHDRPERVYEPNVLVWAPNMNSVDSAESIKTELAGTANVYSPFILKRSYDELSSISNIKLPGDIRELLERTYNTSANFPTWCIELQKKDMEKAKEQEDLAAVFASDVYGELDDDKALTRLISSIDFPLLLVRRIKGEKTRILTLADGREVTIDHRHRSVHAIAALHENMVKTPTYLLAGTTPVEWLDGFVHGPVYVGLLDKGNEVILSGATNLRYDVRGLAKA